MRYRFHFDEHRCAACGACVVACLDEHDADLAAGDPSWRAVRVIECAPRFRYRSESCLHCADAPCIAACPRDCLRKNEHGLTVWDNAACVGCRRCLPRRRPALRSGPENAEMRRLRRPRSRRTRPSLRPRLPHRCPHRGARGIKKSPKGKRPHPPEPGIFGSLSTPQAFAPSKKAKKPENPDLFAGKRRRNASLKFAPALKD